MWILAADASGGLILVAAGAVVAALGYVGKLIAAEVMQARTARINRRTSLLRFQALLRAAQTAFEVQKKLRNQLRDSLKVRHPTELAAARVTVVGYDQLFSYFWQQEDLLEPDERELYLVIRGYTQHALQPTNAALLDWLRADSDYRIPRRQADRDTWNVVGLVAPVRMTTRKPISRDQAAEDERKLAVMLNQLDTHLTLWLAKYEAWIPDRPEHALNYTSDEKKHGAAFPHGIEGVVERVLMAQGIVVPRADESSTGDQT